MLNLDTSRPLLQQAKPLLDLASSVRPIIMLPFNIWLFFVTLPFRVLFFLTSQLKGSTPKEKVQEVKEKVMEIKEEVVQKLPEQLKPQAIEQTLQSIGEESGVFDWYNGVKNVEERPAKEEKKAEPAFTVDPLEELRQDLSKYMTSEAASKMENVRLQEELKELQSKLHSDEEALKNFAEKDARLKHMISVEQRKCYDLQQGSVTLRQRIKKLEEDKEAAEKRPKTETTATTEAEKTTKPAKLGAKKSKKVAEPAMPEKTEAQLEKEDPLNHPHGWAVKNSSEVASHYTEMCAKVQQEEKEHGPTFADVLKEATKPAAAPVETEADFLVVGGDNSMHHIHLPLPAK